MPEFDLDEAIRRKRRSEALLVAEGVRVNAHLPIIEREAEKRPRPAQEVAERLLALTLAAIKGEGEDDVAAQVTKERDAGRLFSPEEAAFINDPAPSAHDRTQFAWRYEAAWVLFWALGWTEDRSLGMPRAICDVPLLAGTVGNEADLAVHGVKPTHALLDGTDLIYRCHWATRQARLDGVAPSGDLNPGVTMERHKALNWLTGYSDFAAWDDVGDDT